MQAFKDLLSDRNFALAAVHINIMHPVDSYLSRFEVKQKIIQADLFHNILVNMHGAWQIKNLFGPYSLCKFYSRICA